MNSRQHCTSRNRRESRILLGRRTLPDRFTYLFLESRRRIRDGLSFFQKNSAPLARVNLAVLPRRCHSRPYFVKSSILQTSDLRFKVMVLVGVLEQLKFSTPPTMIFMVQVWACYGRNPNLAMKRAGLLHGTTKRNFKYVEQNFCRRHRADTLRPCNQEIGQVRSLADHSSASITLSDKKTCLSDVSVSVWGELVKADVFKNKTWVWTNFEILEIAVSLESSHCAPDNFHVCMIPFTSYRWCFVLSNLIKS